MKNLLLRTFTGFIYVAVLTGCIFYGIYSFAVLFSIITALCLWEFYGLLNTNNQINVNKIPNVIGGVFLFIATFLFVWKDSGPVIFLPYLFYLLFTFISELYRKKENPLQNWAYSFLGQIYIALPLSLLNKIALLPSSISGESNYSPLVLLSLFVFIWINDTGAYLVGMTIGKHRLFERISPKKSWEGFFGGLVLSVLSSLIFAHFYPEISSLHWMGIALSIVILGTFGDLSESLMKRTLNVKDSGNSLPGHGGFLDRFDSLLFAIYALFIYIELLQIG